MEGMRLDDIGLINPEECEFYINPNGFLALKLAGKDFKRVALTRAMPFSEPARYIGVNDGEGKEIGILGNVGDLEAKQAEIVRAELENRYFCPEITEVISVKDKMGMFYFEVDISGFKKLFTVKDVSKNVKRSENGTVRFTDADGNRYFISDLKKISAKSRRKIEAYLY